MEDLEFAKFILEDTATYALHAAVVYIVPLSLYWMFVG
jgi:hypothetical protein